jgi:5-methylcytosine-specific restriction endonuclease McrA
MIVRKKASCRVKIPRAVRDTLMQSQRGICFICGRSLLGGDLHTDHIVEVRRGGSSDLQNLRVVHAQCNLERARLLGDPVL